MSARRFIEAGSPAFRAVAAGSLALASACLAATVAAAQDEGAAVQDAESDETGESPVFGPVLAPELPRGTPGEIEAADPAMPVTSLVAALERAYWTSPALLAERARLRSADYRMPQARSQFGPRINYEVGYGYQRDNVELVPGTWRERSGWSTTAAAVLTQPVLTFGRNAAGVRAAAAEIGFERATLRNAEQRALLNAIAAYAGVLRDRNDIAITRENLDLLERELSDNRKRLAVRETTLTDVDQVRTRVELGRARLLDATQTAASSEASFVLAVGAPAGELEAPNPLTMPVRSLDEAYALAAEHSPVIAAAYSREKISRSQRDMARADFLPRVDLRGRAETGAVTPYSDTLQQSQLRGEVVISGPLFASGLYEARLGEAQAANDADWRLIDQALRENRLEVADAWNQWLALNASLASLAAAVESAQSAYNGALLQERAGFRTTLDVVDLARELLSARTQYNATTAAAYIAGARLLAAMGELEYADLLPDASAYHPDEHYERVRDNGDFPLITPLLHAVDDATLGGDADRPVRDPAGGVTTPGVALPAPAEVTGGAYELCPPDRVCD